MLTDEVPAARLIHGPAWVGTTMVLEPQYSATWRPVSGLPACAHLACMPFTWAAPTTPTTPCPSAFCPASHSRLNRHQAPQIIKAASTAYVVTENSRATKGGGAVICLLMCSNSREGDQSSLAVVYAFGLKHARLLCSRYHVLCTHPYSRPGCSVAPSRIAGKPSQPQTSRENKLVHTSQPGSCDEANKTRQWTDSAKQGGVERSAMLHQLCRACCGEEAQQWVKDLARIRSRSCPRTWCIASRLVSMPAAPLRPIRASSSTCFIPSSPTCNTAQASQSDMTCFCMDRGFDL